MRPSLLNGVLTGPAIEDVGSSTAEDVVIPTLAVDHIVTVDAFKMVVTLAAVDIVVSSPTCDAVRSVVTPERVRSCRKNRTFDRLDSKRSGLEYMFDY